MKIFNVGVMESSFQHSPRSLLGHSSILYRKQRDAIVKYIPCNFLLDSRTFTCLILMINYKRKNSDMSREIVH